MNSRQPSGPIVRIMVVEDLTMMRGFFEDWVKDGSQFVLAGSARSGEDALRKLDAMRPDVALVDYQLPGMDGLGFVRAARQMRPQMRALIVTTFTDALTLTRVRESGVEGYLEKDAPPEMLLEALGAVANGRQYYSKRFRETMAEENAKAEAVSKILSRREQQVLAQVLEQKTNREIAELLGLSVRTVEYHRANVLAKLEVSKMNELKAQTQTRGIVRP